MRDVTYAALSLSLMHLLRHLTICMHAYVIHVCGRWGTLCRGKILLPRPSPDL